MTRAKGLKYFTIFIVPLIGVFAFYAKGIWSWFLPVFVYVMIPLVELFNKGTTENFTEVEEEVARHDRFYDYLVYAIVPIQWGLFIAFMFIISDPTLETYEIAGLTFTMGLGCGAFGINIAHELGHRKKKYEQWMAKALLLTAQYMHFFIEHNRGHHKNVSTEEDPATARYGEWFYAFWFRSVIGSYVSAWKLELSRLKKRNLPWYHWSNEMIFYAFCQVGLIAVVAAIFGVKTAGLTLTASVIGFSLLEIVNYVEHYGLVRQKTDKGYKKVLPIHSWNSNHPLGRLLLMEVTRHSDHHYKASRKYQILRHFDDAPQMPTGYPGMIVLATMPPLWFAVMNPRVKALQEKYPEDLRVPVAQAA